MHYCYVLLSHRDGRLYTGCTENLRKRVLEHNAAKVVSTAHRIPLQLIYYEACSNRFDSFRRERFLKTGKGKRYLKNRLARFLTDSRIKLAQH